MSIERARRSLALCQRLQRETDPTPIIKELDDLFPGAAFHYSHPAGHSGGRLSIIYVQRYREIGLRDQGVMQFPKGVGFHAYWVARLSRADDGSPVMHVEKSKIHVPTNELEALAHFQGLVGVTPDGILGHRTRATMDRLIHRLEQQVQEAHTKKQPMAPPKPPTRWERLLLDKLGE